MGRLVTVPSQRYPFGFSMLPTALLQRMCNTPASSLGDLWGPGGCLSARAVSIERSNQIHLLQQAVQRKQ